MADVLSENYGSRSSPIRYIPVGDIVRKKHTGNSGRLGVRTRLKRVFKDAFLPQGYPDSVSEDYLMYQTWDTMQAFCSYITGTLATQAVLKGVGVGDSSASPVAATITWLLKDGLGMIGRILFAWLKGTDLDCNAKRWRLVADFLNDIAMFIDLLAPIFPAFFMLIVCLSSVTRSIVGVAGGATRAALVQHQARRDNMADVSAKDGSQETLVNLAGLIVGLVLTPLISGRQEVVWFLFMIFTFLHLYANYQAVSVVCMEKFNRSRIHLFMKEYLSTGGATVLTPKEVNLIEPVINGCRRNLNLHLGCSLSNMLLNSTDYEMISKQVGDHKQEYIVYISPDSNDVYVAFSVNSCPIDHIRAVITAEILEYIYSNGSHSFANNVFASYTTKINWLKSDEGKNKQEIVTLAHEIASGLFSRTENLISKVEKSGWVVSHHLLGLEEWRYNPISYH